MRIRGGLTRVDVWFAYVNASDHVRGVLVIFFRNPFTLCPS